MKAAVLFCRREHSKTHWIEISYPVDQEPTEMLQALSRIGWAEQTGYRRLPTMSNKFHSAWEDETPEFQVQQIELIKEGTGLFNGWTDQEKRSNMAQARRALRKFGFVGVPVWAKTMADML